MAFNERLALLITADYQQAVRGIEATGKSAEKNLGAAESRTAKFGATATKVGAGMVGFGAIVGAGLFKAAQASEDANLSTVKLTNTIEKMPKLAGSNVKAFTDLATAIQHKTAADADAIIEGEALLGTFNLTAKEIQGITPLVVDYARKFGTDIPSAAIQVGKALDGQIGALKRNGVSIDEVLFKTDRYRAVQEALNQQVGGFAEKEGATLSGRLQRLKNELGDVEEGVGAGVGGAFSAALTPVEKMTTAFGSLSPATQEAVGHFGTIGAATVAAAGGLLLMAGQAQKVEKAFAEGGAAAGKFGTVIKGLGVLGVIAAIASAMQAYAKSSEHAEVSTEALANATDRQLAQAFTKARGTLEKWGESADDWFRTIAEASVTDGQRMIDALAGQGEETSHLQKILDDLIKSKRQQATVSRENTEVLDEEKTAEEKVKDAEEKRRKETERLNQALEDQKKALDDLLDGTMSYLQAQLGLADAENGVRDALKDYLEVEKQHGPASAEAGDSLLRLRESFLGTAQAAVDSAEAQRQSQGRAALTTQEKVAIQVAELRRLEATLDKKSPLRKILDEYIGTLQKVPTDIETVIGITYAERNKIPPSVKTVEDQIAINKDIPLPAGTQAPDYQAPAAVAPAPVQDPSPRHAMSVTQNIYTNDPLAAASASVQYLRAATYLPSGG